MQGQRPLASKWYLIDCKILQANCFLLPCREKEKLTWDQESLIITCKLFPMHPFNWWPWLLAIKISIVNFKSLTQDGHFILDLTAFIDLFNFKIIMHLDIGFLGTIKPDQMQAFNPLFIIILIPLFETVVYPLLKRPKPLKRMCAGMLLGSVAFIFAGFLQMKIQVKLCNIQ